MELKTESFQNAKKYNFNRCTESPKFQVPLSVLEIPTLVLSPDFTMIAANESRLQVTGVEIDDILGRSVFDVFPDNPNDPTAEGVRNLRASLDRVLRDKIPDKMSIQKYDIPIPGSVPLQFEERYWKPVNIPVLNDRQEVTCILHQVEDVTEFIKSQNQQESMVSEIYRRTEQVRAINLELKLAKEELEKKVLERTNQLKESEDRFVQSTAAAQVGVWEIDVQTGLAWRSASHDLIFGYDKPVEKWTLDTFFSHVHREDLALVQKESSFDNDTWNFEFRIFRIDGALRWMMAKGEVVRDEKGQPLKVRGVNYDITDRKNAEIEREIEKQKFETLFQESPSAMALLKGEDFVFEKVNARYQQVSGRSEVEGLRFQDAFPEVRDTIFPKLIKRVYETGETYHGNEAKVNFVRHQGCPPEDSYWNFAYIRILDLQGKPYGVYISAQDVTDRILSRLKLEEAQRQLIKAKENAEAANRMKSAFLANMSHEIRTPMGAIIGFTDLLKEPNLVSADRERFLDIISRSGRSLIRLIDDILDLTKIEAGRLGIESIEFPIHDLLFDVVELFREKAREKRIDLKLDIAEGTPSYIHSDPSRLRQILVNLIGNSVKFTQEGYVHIKVSSRNKADDAVEMKIEVIDSGIGLSEEQKQSLFQPFSQADNTTTRKYGGTGLGLFLSKRLSEALGGSISIDQCEPGQGCTFTLHFAALKGDSKFKQSPTSSSEKRSDEYAMAESQQLFLTDIKVLAVDDSPDNLFLVKRFLNQNGAAVETADNGEMAVEKALSRDYDIILMDIQMPKMDGYQSKKFLDEKGYSSPIVALTAHAMKEDIKKTFEAGFSGHLVKPINKKELLDTVSRIVHHHRESHPIH